MSSVILIRHSESLGNVDEKFYRMHDQANILTAKGVEQCLQLSGEMRSLMDLDFKMMETE